MSFPAMAAVLALVLAACSAGGTAGSGGTGSAEPASMAPSATTGGNGAGADASLAPAELATMLEAKDFLLVNVHVPYEGEIEGTDAFIPYDQIASRVGELPSDRAARIVLYCRSGRMSAIAAETLAGLGYTNIQDLDGGFDAWVTEGYPLVQRPQG